MNNLNQLCIAAICVCFIGGCATAPQPIIDSMSLEKATTHTLSEAVYFSTLFTNCAALGGDTEIDTIDIQQNWLNQNSDLIAAADNLYSQQQASSSFTYMGHTLSPAAIRLAMEARSRATNELALAQRSPTNKVKTCAFRLAQITGTKLSLANDPLISPYAQEILKHPSLNSHISETPSLAGGLSGAPQGATYFSIAKAHENSCDNAYTLSIANAWPIEVYANFCGDKATAIINCEWGKCTTKTL
jgi:hypothetical protein